MPGIIDLPKFNYEDLEEIVSSGQGSLGVYLVTQVVTYVNLVLSNELIKVELPP